MNYYSVYTNSKYFNRAIYHGVCNIGDVVKILVGKKNCVGIVISQVNKPEFTTKIAISTGFTVPEYYIKFLSELEHYTFVELSSLINILKMFSTRYKKITQYIQYQTIKLSNTQMIIYNQINSGVHLLYGVTGSGKSEIFLKKIADILSKDLSAQILILVPEILLTYNIIERIKKYFNIQCTAWHSGSRNKNTFTNIAKGNIPIVVGARSALNLVFHNLCLIIVDEEHSESYSDGKYNARDGAVLLGNILNIPVILCSATPSIESYYNVLNKKYKLLELKERFMNYSMPTVKFIKSHEILSKYSLERTLEEVNKKHQVIFFINRRGYTPAVICKSCYTRLICNTCEHPLTWHKTLEYIQCHKCDKKYSATQCNVKNCNQTGTLVGVGWAVERVASYLEKYFPDKLVKILSSDTLNSTSNNKLILEDIHNNKIDIIVATQLFSKGYDFHNITLVVVVNLSNLGFDYKLNETIMQTMFQISGRGGRGGQDAEFILQNNKSLAILPFIEKYDYLGFLNYELQIRLKWQLPPTILICMLKSNKILKQNNLNIISSFKNKEIYISLIKLERNNYLTELKNIKELCKLYGYIASFDTIY